MEFKSLAEFLHPYRQEALVEAIGISKATAHSWYHGKTLPRDGHVPELARFLRLTIGELAQILADERRRRSLERIAAIA